MGRTCRLVRAEVMKHKEKTYVQAARALGIGSGRIMFKHILPNILHIIIVTFTLRFPAGWNRSDYELFRNRGSK